MRARGRFVRRVVTRVVVGLLLVAAAAAVGVGELRPALADRMVGEARMAVGRAADAGRVPTIRLGGPGGRAELDACRRRTFIEMIDYRGPGHAPGYAAHNMCGGDVILGWEPGQQVRIEDRPGLYRVVEVKPVAKDTATTDDLRGLDGELILQTCYYGRPRMRLVGLSPIR